MSGKCIGRKCPYWSAWDAPEGSSGFTHFATCGVTEVPEPEPGSVPCRKDYQPPEDNNA